MRPSVTSIIAATTLFACSSSGADGADPRTSGAGDAPADSGSLVTVVRGFTAPEAVRYDPDQDLYFVSNWGQGPADATDDNGFISRMTADGVVDSPRFIAGGVNGATLHSPRGMTIVGDTLWVVDVDAVRGFDRRTGAPLATVDFSTRRLGFLNDIASGADALYVTDTGTDHIYRIAAGTVTVSMEDATLGGPNGITWDAEEERFIVVPWGGGSTIRAWAPGSDSLTDIGTSDGTRFDGVEVLARDRVLVASQGDSSLHLFTGGIGRPVIRTGGEPADIAVDTRRTRVAVPFVRRNLVEIWQLPPRR